MPSRLPLLLLLLGFSSAASAGTIRPDPSFEGGRLLSADAAQSARQPLEPTGREWTPAFPSSKADFTLNCENDNVMAPVYTLSLRQGDLAGSLLSLPDPGVRYDITDISLGFVDMGASYPTDIAIQLFVYDGSQFYDGIGAFIATLDGPLAGGMEILSYDLTPFELVADDELLVLFGQHPDVANPQLFPVADSTPRCSGGGQEAVCSVLIPSGGAEFFAYAYDFAELCLGKDPLLLADLVVELGVSEQNVPVEKTSFGAVKALF